MVNKRKSGWQSEETVKHHDRVTDIFIQRKEEMLSTIVNILPFSKNEAVLIMAIRIAYKSA